jgi:hypothetical protein
MGNGERRFAQEGSSASTGKEGSRSGGARHARRSQDCARVIKKGRGDRALCALRVFFSTMECALGLGAVLINIFFHALITEGSEAGCWTTKEIDVLRAGQNKEHIPPF